MNAIYLICEPCEKTNEADFGVKVASRSSIGAYHHEVPSDQFDIWLMKHRNCGGNLDHFILGMQNERNSDQPKKKILSLKAVK